MLWSLIYIKEKREREKLEQTWSGKNSTRNSIPLLTTFKYLINCYSNLSKSYLYTIICRIKWSRFFIYQQITICRQNILEKTKKRCPSKLVDLSSRILTSFPTIFDSPSLPDHEKNERNAFARSKEGIRFLEFENRNRDEAVPGITSIRSGFARHKNISARRCPRSRAGFGSFVSFYGHRGGV